MMDCFFVDVGLSRFELETSSLSVTRSNQLSYKPVNKNSSRKRLYN